MNGQELAAHWQMIAKAHDEDMVVAALHDDVVFESPVVHTPQVGKAITTAYLASAAKVLGNEQFEYVNVWHAERSCILEFRTEIEGLQINGIDMITCDDNGHITHFKVMVRPLKAVNILHAKMMAMLENREG